MTEWRIAFADGTSQPYAADRLFVTPSGVLIFTLIEGKTTLREGKTPIEGKRSIPTLVLAPGEWKQVVRMSGEQAASTEAVPS